MNEIAHIKTIAEFCTEFCGVLRSFPPYPPRKNSAKNKITDSERIKLALERLDDVATRYEKKWGVDRLINLVDQHLAEQFQEQLDLLNVALERHFAEDVIAHADALARGWAALDAAAESQGSPQIDAAAWEVITHPPGGRLRL